MIPSEISGGWLIDIEITEEAIDRVGKLFGDIFAKRKRSHEKL